MTQLQKLLYYAQVELLIDYHRPLFEEEIQSWNLEPVIHTV
ncbi:type II toxin-antitoxin system antitoxin SocA domain-containing protein [Candidatus Phytoplasma asiaticum]